MRKMRIWKLLAGITLIVVVIVMAVNLINHHDKKLVEQIALGATAVAWAVVGGYLINSYLKDKDREDSNQQPEVAIVPNSPEDFEKLRLRKSKILLAVFIVEIISSLSTWITNDFSLGFVQENIRVVFDLLIHIPVIFLLYGIYKNRDVLNKFFYTVMFMTLGYLVVDIWGKDWFEVGFDLLVGLYLLFYIRSLPTRRNFRIANFIILPLVLIVPIVYFGVSSAHLTELTKKEQVQENDFAAASLDLSSKYTALVQNNDLEMYPSLSLSVRGSLKDKENKIKTLDSTIEEIQKEIEKDPDSNIDLKNKLDLLYRVLKLHQTFDGKIEDVVIFVEGLDLNNVTDEDSEQFITLTQEVITVQKDLQDLSKELLTQ